MHLCVCGGGWVDGRATATVSCTRLYLSSKILPVRWEDVCIHTHSRNRIFLVHARASFASRLVLPALHSRAGVFLHSPVGVYPQACYLSKEGLPVGWEDTCIHTLKRGSSQHALASFSRLCTCQGRSSRSAPCFIRRRYDASVTQDPPGPASRRARDCNARIIQCSNYIALLAFCFLSFC
jgi:hypothetical protein